MNIKKKVLALALAVICLSSLAYGTLAFFTYKDVAHNVITSGDIKIELLEWADEAKKKPFPDKGVSGVVPGMEVTKIVEVKNTCDNAAYVRVKVDKDITLAQGVTAAPDTGYLDIKFDTENWTWKDGYYYYNKPLAPHATTEPLFAAVTFDPQMGNEYQNSTATVTVKAYAVQVVNNEDTALTAGGWPAD